MHNKTTLKKHTWGQSILLHLGPGLLATALYFLTREPVIKLGFPSVFALMISILVIIVPLELGYLLYIGKQQSGRYTLQGVFHDRQPIPVWQYLVWSLVVFVVVGLIFTLFKPVDQFLQENLFGWVPQMTDGLDGSISKTNLWITYLAMVLLGVLAGPTVEELYFRGYLLPRVPGKFSALTHSFLFAVYHFFTPWMVITRTIGMLPIIYAVKRKNIYIAIIVHVLVNAIDAVMGFAFIAALG